MTNASKSYAHDVLGEHPFALGLFGSNVSGGITMTGAEGAFDLSWESTSNLAKQADDLGLDLLVPVARWRGYGGRSNPNG